MAGPGSLRAYPAEVSSVSTHHRSRARRRAIALGVGFLLLASALTFTKVAWSRKTPTTRPNVILILTDDMRWDELANMPNVRSLLMAHGVTFTRAFVSNSLCCPSRAGTLSGQFSSRNRVWNNDWTRRSPWGGFRSFLPHEHRTLAVWLHDAGYQTSLVGKYLNGYGEDSTPLGPRPGWDNWEAFYGGTKYYDYQLNLNGTLSQYGESPDDYSTTVLENLATEYVQHAPIDSPFFLYFAPYAPHEPFLPAPAYADALPWCAAGTLPPGCYRPYTSPNIAEVNVSDKPTWVQRLPLRGARWNPFRRHQEQQLLSVDDAVGALVAAVAARGQLSHTMFVFTSDNGLSGGSHRWIGKKTPWEEAIRVPMVVRYDPLTAPRAGTVDASAMLLNADFAPSVLAATGVVRPADYRFDGRSWLPLLRDAPIHWRTAFPLEHLSHAGVDPPSYCGVRTDGWGDLPGQWMFVRYIRGAEELYHLNADPYELGSLNADPRFAHAEAELLRLTMRLCNPPPPGYRW